MAFPYSSGDVLTAADLNASSGLVLVKSQTIGSGVSSVTVSNVFSSTFDNYRVTVTGTTNSVAYAQFELRLASSGTPSSTSYDSRLLYSAFGGSTPAATFVNNSTAGFLWWGGPKETTSGFANGHGVIDLFLPFAAVQTFGVSAMYGTSSAGGNSSGVHKVAASYDGFVVKPEIGTWTGGTIRVYGYNNG
jgi:hypothetical protein